MNFLTFFSISFFSQFLYAQTPDLDISKIVKKIEVLTSDAKEKWEVPGVAITIVHKGKPYYIIKGEKDINTKEPINKNTKFPISSVTKTFTGALVCILADKGYLKLDDPIIKYIPDFKLENEDDTKQLTIKHVLSHASGLPWFAGDSFLKLGFDQKYIFNILSKVQSKAKPGEKLTYNNTIVGIIEKVVEKATGMKFDDAAEKFLFKPLELHNISYKNPYKTTFFGNKKIPDNYVSLHGFNNGIVSLPENESHYVQRSSMGISTDIEDSAKWLMFNLKLSEKIISKEMFNLMHEKGFGYTPKTDIMQFPKERMSDIHYCITRYSLTWGTKEKNTTVYMQMGAWTGIRSIIAYAPEYDLGIIVLTNYGSWENYLPESIYFSLLDMVLDIEDINWLDYHLKNKKEQSRELKESYEKEKYLNPKPHEDLDYLAGIYTNQYYGKIEIKNKKRKLFFKYTKKDEQSRLTHKLLNFLKKILFMSDDQWIELEHNNANRFNFDAFKINKSFAADFNHLIEIGHIDNKMVLVSSIISQEKNIDNIFYKS